MTNGIKVLVGCEESQAVTIAFRKLGFSAYSCDLKPCSGGHPEWHFKMDVSEVLKGGTFPTQLGILYSQTIEKWDLIIAHPTCTFLSNAGAARLYPKKGVLNPDRFQKGLLAKEFFMLFFNHSCKNIAIENPIPSTVFGLPKYDQIIQPFEHGHPYSKKTCIWLKGLPKLKPTEIVSENIISWVSGGSKDHKGNPRKQSGTKHRDSETRSKTFPGIAKAMAGQWGEYLLNQKKDEL